jgi:hypothetical protein
MVKPTGFREYDARWPASRRPGTSFSTYRSVAAMVTAADRDPGRSMAELYRAVPNSFGSPTMSANCAGEFKDRVVGDVRGGPAA